tara:strand:- start:1512 stop:7328 length:5817 start_codon:yes stop_codon:yes gene_type:complete
MTVIFPSSTVELLPISSDAPYLVAFSSSGINVGSASFALNDLIGGQQTIAIWGDDSATPENDGAQAGEEINFKLVDGNLLYEVSVTSVMGSSVSFVPNGIVPIANVTSALDCSTPLLGCTDQSACNFDPAATDDNGSCVYAESYFDCNGDCLLDSDGDLICDEFEVVGCQDLLALNYDSDATDQGNCEYLGCMDSMYFEYNPNATISNGSCYTEVISGCIDSSANNYNPNANNYDGSCTFDSGLNHIFISDPIDGFAYATGTDIIINFEFISSDITIGYSFQGADALIRYSINGGSLTNIASSSGEISLGELSDGEYSIEFTLHSSGSGLPQWDPLVQTTVNFSIGPVGCTDEIACNYDSEAVAHDYSCIYPAFYYDCYDVCNSDIDNDLICDELEILGCQDSLALNYDSTATDAGGCDYLGCTDSLYIEFNQNATIDDGSCDILKVFGCMNENSFNYDSFANVDDASCYNVVNGCMDTLAFNFNDYDYDGYPNPITGIPGIDVNTAIDDCDFYGCMQPTAENYDSLANINVASIDSIGVEGHDPCVYAQIPGCTDDTACNYSVIAEVDDGSCLYNDICGECGGPGPDLYYECDGTCTNDTDGDGVCNELEIVGCQDSLAVNFNSLATDPDSCDYLGCTDTLYFEYDSIATVNDGSCETLIVYGCTDQDYLEYWSYDTLSFSISNLDLIPNFDNGSCENLLVYGCTNSIADNYNASVNIDNGSCIISGCIDPFAINTDSLANDDDGSCVYETFVDTSDINLNEDCILPEPYTGNTGNNMTIFLTSSVISSLPLTSSSPYIVAITNSGLTVGSVSLAEEDLLGGQQSLAVWGDDSSTPETDGALSTEEISFQLVDGNSLYDLSVASSVAYISNSTTPIFSMSSSLNCSSTSSPVSCDIPSSVSINTGSNMTIFFLASAINSLPLSTDTSYILAISSSGIVVGSASLALEDLIGGQQSLAVWGDDSSTPETDGALSGEEISFQLADGSSLYDLSVSLSVTYISNSTIPISSISSSLNCSSLGQVTEVTGCMHSLACNYDPLATSPSSCTYANIGYDCDENCLVDTDLDGICDEFEVVGCADFLAFNFNPYSTEDGNCEYLGCTDSLYIEFNPLATIDDQSCETLIFTGCLDVNADNYDSNANVSDNSCVYDNISNPYIQVLINSDIPQDAYLEGEDIFIEYSFYPGNDDISVSFPASGNALIRCVIDDGAYISLFAPFAPGHPFSNSIFSDSFDFENGTHTIEFTLYSSDAGLPIWDPLVQTSIEFEIGPAGCTDPNAGNYIPSAVVDDNSCIDNAELDFDSEVINTGSNHTIYIPADVVFPEVMNFNQEEDLLGAFYLSNGYPTLGSEMVFDESVSDGSFQVVVFGDDSSTPETDGFFDGQEFIWAFQDAESGNSLFLNPIYQNTTASNSYINDGIFVVTSFEILYGLTGCMNSDYLEYNALPFVEEDTTLCQTPVVFGCMDDTYCEYNSAANTDNGSCSGLPGCTDEAYLEFDVGASCDDGSCFELVVEGCTDNLAENYDSLANTLIDVCIYDVCVQFDVNNFVIEYSDFLGEIVLSFDITNTSDNKIIYAPEFEINLNSSIVELGSLSYNIDSLSFNEYNSATVSAIITNDSLSVDFDPLFELLSGVITLTSDSVINGLSDTANCSFYFNDEMLNTSHLGCTNEFAFNYDSLATINNGSCIDNLNAVVISNSPLCHDDYGEAFLYITGGTPPYSLLVDNSVTYTSYSELGIPNEFPVNINDLGVAEFEGLNEGIYAIEVIDDVGAVFIDSITISLPSEIQVDAIVEDDFLLTSSSNVEPYIYQWLFNGQYIEGANSDVHYPQEIGIYQVYIEDVYGCSDFSDEVFLPEIGLHEFNKHSFTIYPNPAHTSISLNISQLNSKTLLSINDVLGQEVNKVVLDSQSSKVNYSLDISEWPNGIYFISLENNSKQIVKPFVKH